MKITGADRVFRPIFDAVFGYGEESVLAQYIGPDLAAATRALFAGKITDEDTKRDVAQTLAREVEAAYDALLSRYVTPLVMYIGATGLIPDSLEGITAVSVEDLEARGVDLSKAEKEGMFYRLPNGVLISVYSKTKDTPGPNAPAPDEKNSAE
jgi:hypothetical protein